MLGSMMYPRNTKSRRILDMTGFWKFKFDPKQEGLNKGWEKGLYDALTMPVPSSFNDFFTDKESREYTGDFWYETEVFVPGEWKDNNVDIRFDSATHRATVFVNGVKLAFHEGGFVPFSVRINEVVKWNDVNQVVVLLNNELSLTTLPAGETKILSDGTKMSKPYFDFYNYSGLQRPVRLVVTPKEAITNFTVNHKLTGNDSITEYVVVTTGEHDVEVSVYDEDKKLVAVSKGKKGAISIENSRLWNVLDAYLYTFKIIIKDQDEIIDEYYDNIGIRTIEVKGTSLLINNKPVYLKGFGKHEDADIRGRGFDLAVVKRDFELMKWIGANSFRTSHYPYCEEILQMADREGFVVIDEVAAVGFMVSTMNFLDAGTGKKTASFFEHEEVQTVTKEVHKKALEELITRDHNHACVCVWSLLNEPETVNDAAVPYFKEIFEYARSLDVQKRPRTFSLILMSLPNTCKCYQFADIIALNRYYGWYLSGGYELREAKENFLKEMEGWSALNLDKPFIFTEYGADTVAGIHKLPSVQWSEEYQCEYLDMQHEVFDSFDFVIGEQVWNFADFQTTEGILRTDGNKKGIFTRDRQPKAAAHFLKKRWNKLPLDYKRG